MGGGQEKLRAVCQRCGSASYVDVEGEGEKWRCVGKRRPCGRKGEYYPVVLARGGDGKTWIAVECEAKR
ncbi:MAG: hypothetical protein WC686_00945 [Candidatus Shapirobacteria bacterium]|jgi:hypothetical protein